MMPRVTSVDILVAVAITALLAVWALIALVLMDKPEKGREEREEERDAGAWLMRARYGNTWGAQHIRASLTTLRALIAAAEGGTPWEPPKTSPAAPPRPFAGGADAPGTTAAAAGEGPPASPPPLPDDDWTAAAAFAAANPGREPFEVWQSDEFVTAYNAITGSTP